MEMFYIIVPILCILGVIFYFVRNYKKTITPIESLSSKKTEIKYIKIEKNNEKSYPTNDENYSLNIQSISQLLDHIEFVLEIKNNTDHFIKINIKKVTLIQANGSVHSGDYSYLDFMMGTNDLILKNTILSGMTLIRNIKFEQFDINTISVDDKIDLELEINDNLHCLSIDVNGSEVADIKVIRLSDV